MKKFTFTIFVITLVLIGVLAFCGFIRIAKASPDPLPDSLKTMMCSVLQGTKNGKVSWLKSEYTYYWRGIEIGPIWLRFNIPGMEQLSYIRSDNCSAELLALLNSKYMADQKRIEDFVKDIEQALK